MSRNRGSACRKKSRLGGTSQTLRLKGLDPKLVYQVNGEGRWPGDVLMEAGWPLPLDLFQGDYRSLQLYISKA